MYRGYLKCKRIVKCSNFPDGCSVNCKYYISMVFTSDTVDMKKHKVLPRDFKERLSAEPEGKIKNLFKPFIINQGEQLRLICHNCGHEWVETRPEGYLVRHNKSTNFLINSKKEKISFKCPKCKKDKIGRLAVKKPRGKNRNIEMR